MRFARAATLLLLAGLGPQPSRAQEAVDDGVEQLPIVTVTAQKITQRLEDVPASISSVDGAVFSE